MQLHALGERYIEELQAKNAATLSNLRRILTYFGSLSALTPNKVMDYVIYRRQAGAKPATINREITILKQFCTWLVKTAVIPDNPAGSLKYEKPDPFRMRWLTIDEELRLIQASPTWLGNIIIVATSTGLRRGELLNLRWEHVDLRRQILTVVRSKNGKPRIIPLTKRAIAVLSVLRTQTTDPEQYVFVGRDLKPVSPNTLEYYFRLAVKQAGLSDIHFHDLRHSYASRLIQGGTDIYAVQRLLGHQNPSMTQRYAHHNVESLRKAVEILP